MSRRTNSGFLDVNEWVEILEQFQAAECPCKRFGSRFKVLARGFKRYFFSVAATPSTVRSAANAMSPMANMSFSVPIHVSAFSA